MTTLTIFDTSFFVFLLSIILIYIARGNLLTDFNIDKVVESVKQSETLENFIVARYQLFQWRFLFWSVGLLFVTSTLASYVVSMNDEKVKYGDMSYSPILSSKDRVILIGPTSAEKKDKKVISIPSSELSCSGNEGACTVKQIQTTNNSEDIRLSINQATVGELKVLSARGDDIPEDTDPAYSKLISC